MKAILEFNLDDFDDTEKYKLYNQAKDMYLAIWDFQQFLRNMEKHNDMTEKEYEIFEKLNDKFYEVLDNYNVDEVLS